MSATQREVVRKGTARGSRARAVPAVQTLRWEDGGALSAVEQPAGPKPAAPANSPQAVVDAPATPPPNKAPIATRPGDIVLPGLEHRVVLPGTRPGSSYVRREQPSSHVFRQRGEAVVEATEYALQAESPTGKAFQRAKQVVLGRRLATAEQVHERLTKVKALAVLSSDAISSVAYATEASLGVLIGAGTAALTHNLPITACIVLLMIIVGVSYRQTIYAYPSGGGSYIVARDNLGDLPGLIAAAALLIDYVLTVSVSVSSGVDAMVSAIPSLAGLSVALGVVFIILIMLVNLRGIRESGSIFAAPTYLFIGAFAIMIATGIIHALFSPGGPFGAVAPHQSPFVPLSQGGLGWAPEQLSVVLLLTAFASGCVAMTGTEAISNAIPVFKAPESKNAARTLVWMVAILAAFYLGTTYLAWRFGIEPYANQNPTLDSQIARMLFVGPFTWFYYVIQFATLLILVLAANTSFADFPRLSSILARDGFLPHQFVFRGDRLAYSTGIIVLAGLSSVLLVVFHGSTDALINLYALGVFTAFTLSQSGMVVHWYRLRERASARWRRSLGINLVGAFATGIVAVIITISKFDRGAWIVVLLVPLIVLLFKGISRHYAAMRRQTEALTPLKPEELRHIMLVPIAELNRPALQSLAYARSLTQDVIALHVALDDNDEAAFRATWEQFVERRTEALSTVAEGRPAPSGDGASGAQQRKALELLEKRMQLVVIRSPYRSLIAPLKAYIDALRDANPGATVSVILPEFVPAHWWEQVLHGQTTLRLKLALHTDPGVVVVNVPHQLRQRVGGER